MASYMSPGPLCDRCKFCTIQERPDRHSRQFKAISISPVTGIVFKAYEYSAIQLADAFDHIISGYMDFEIKKQALERWNVLLPELLDGPLLRETAFDLKDTFFVLNDFLFLGALRKRCCVEWVDECRTGRWTKTIGWCESGEETNHGPIQWIRLVRPTEAKPQSVRDILITLMHEMCHAIFAFECDCACCRCPLTRLNSEGFSGHGPSWGKLRRSIEKTANTHLSELFGPIALRYPDEPECKTERARVGRMLSGLYKKITEQGSESAELKRVERATERARLLADIAKEQTEEKQLETIACAGDMFKYCESERALGALKRHLASANATVQRARPEKQYPKLVEALDYINTVILKDYKDCACVASSNGAQEDKIYDQQEVEW